MKIAFRPDTNPSVGLGHLMRCLAIAEEMREQGHEVRFLVQPNLGAQKLLSDSAFPWIEVSTSIAEQNTECLKHLTEFKPDIVVLDHYEVDSQWQKACSGLTDQLMCIDDLIDRNFECDILLNQNSEFQNNPYSDLTDAKCRFLFGPRFALLRREFRLERERLAVRTGRIAKVLVYFGGGNTIPEFQKVLSAIEKTHSEIGFLLLTDPQHFSEEMIPKNVRFISPTTNMAALLNSVDLVLGAAGSSVWERCCLGVPSIIVQTADNQKTVAEEAARLGLALVLGKASAVTADSWFSALKEKLNDPEFWQNQSKRCLKTVDGLGVDRVASQLLS